MTRFRNAQPASVVEAKAVDRVPPVPSIATLLPGKHVFGAIGSLGWVAAEWAGFYKPEATWNWAATNALMVFRTVPAVDRLTLTLTGQPWQDGQALYLLVNFGPRVETRIITGAQTTATVPVPDRYHGDLIVLLIEAPEATVVGQDTRALGAILAGVELICDPP